MPELNIDTDALGGAIVPLLVLAAVVWVALVWWTYLDARRRLRDPRLVRLSVAASLVPFVGTAVYMILRPPESLQDAYEREISVASSEKLINVLSELQETQREIYACVQRLEQALHASRRRAVARQATQAPPAGERQ